MKTDITQTENDNHIFTKTSKSAVWFFALIGFDLLFILMLVGLIYFKNQNQQLQSSVTNREVLDSNVTEMPVKTQDATSPLNAEVQNQLERPGPQLYPITSLYKAFVNSNQDSTINVTPIDVTTQPYTVTKYGQVMNGGSLGFGETGITLAPDLEKFAFIDDETIVVASVDGQTEERIPVTGLRYINSWSPDSSNLIVYVSLRTIKNSLFMSEGMIGPPTETQIGPLEDSEGFVMIDFKNKSIRHMHELDGMSLLSRVGNDALILSSGVGNQEQFAYYSMKTGRADSTTVKKLENFFGHQFSFNPDGKIWAHVSSTEPNSTSYAQAALGNFPNIGDIDVIRFPWATRQRPVLSPEGNKLALQGYEVQNGPNYVYLYAGGENLEKIAEGRPELCWITTDCFSPIENL